MNIEILNQFCASNPIHMGMLRPFSQGDYTYATNAHLVIRIPRREEVLENDVAPKMDRLDLDFEKQPIGWFPIPEIGEVQQHVCKECKGLGKTYVCLECDGHGEVSLSTDFSDYDDQTCLSCDGTGTLPKEKWMEMAKKAYRNEEPPDGDECENCEGVGKLFDYKGIPINGALFSDRYLSWLRKLPNCEIGPIDESKPALFRFDGGDGLIMPRRA